MTLKEQKTALRKTLISKRNELLISGEKSKLDASVYNKLINTIDFSRYDIILCYISTEIEVDTLSFINYCLENGKKVAVPKCTPEKMDFYLIESLSDTATGMYGINEPKDYCRKLSYEEMGNSLCLVPALAFNTEGYRIGYGKGYYDKFLSRYTGNTLGLCYSGFIRDDIPVDEFDKQITEVITD